MKVDMVFAAVAVADIEAAIAWYETLFGRPYDERPMKEAAEWRLSAGGGVQLVADAGRAGRSMVTIGVSDLESIAAEFASRGVVAKVSEPGKGRYRLAQVSDPDGNQLTFAQDQQT